MALHAESPRVSVGIIWALSKHAQHVQNMSCISKGVEMLLLLEAAWLYLPTLQLLGVSMPVEVLTHASRSKLTLPSSLRALELKISQRSSWQISLDSLQTYSPLLTRLTLDSTDYVYTGGYGYAHHQQRHQPQVLFSGIDLPSLWFMRLKGPYTFSGQLMASCLTQVSIENHAGLSWKHFTQCRRLENVQISSNGMLDFIGSEPLSLASVQTICLEAAIIREDGAFHGLEASRLDSLVLKVKAVSGSQYKLGHLQADMSLMWNLEAAKGYTICSISRRSCSGASARHDCSSPVVLT